MIIGLENKIQGCLEKMPQTHLIIGSDVEKMLPAERENLYHLLLEVANPKGKPVAGPRSFDCQSLHPRLIPQLQKQLGKPAYTRFLSSQRHRHVRNGWKSVYIPMDGQTLVSQ